MPLPYQLDAFTPEAEPKAFSKPILTQALKQDFATSAKTSIFRSGASAPMKVIIAKGLLSKGSSINFGKGRFNHDTDEMKKITGHSVGYDYVYLPDIEVLGSSYDYLFASYVVNTLPRQARSYVWVQMSEICRGIAFVAARTDLIKGIPDDDGIITSKKTWQKSYKKNELVEEALDFFDHVIEIKGKSGFSLVACSHQLLPERVLKHAK